MLAEEQVPTEGERAKVSNNLNNVIARISNSVAEAKNGPYFRGRQPALVAVSKTKHIDLIKACYDAGQRKFGENYIQELEEKSSQLSELCPEIQWHFIGRIQSNKIKKLSKVKNLYCVETLDSEEHTHSLNREMEKLGRVLNVMVQVNTSKEEQKGGLPPTEALELAGHIRSKYASLKLCGFMTIGSYEVSVNDGFNEEFAELFKTREMFCRKENVEESDLDLSMGMSHDFEAAIRQGSTSVRVGSSIFGVRSYAK